MSLEPKPRRPELQGSEVKRSFPLCDSHGQRSFPVPRNPRDSAPAPRTRGLAERDRTAPSGPVDPQEPPEPQEAPGSPERAVLSTAHILHSIYLVPEKEISEVTVEVSASGATGGLGSQDARETAGPRVGGGSGNQGHAGGRNGRALSRAGAARKRGSGLERRRARREGTKEKASSTRRAAARRPKCTAAEGARSSI